MKMLHSVNTASALRSMPHSNANRPPRCRPLQQLFTLLAGLALAAPALACGDHSGGHLERLAIQAVSKDPNISGAAIAALRAGGPIGLRTLFDVHADTLQRHSTNTALAAMHPPDGEWRRLKDALDAVGQQRDCYASKLFWFTDLEQAKAAAKASGKPILSLRLLGKLDEEFSCANSRFFRTTLYANARVSRYLRDHVVLHWKSVRPVPKVTIDFGDGRKLERTITGNSIHYILDADGRPIDALPGLYGPQAFLSGLKRAEETARKCAATTSAESAALLRQYHVERLAAIHADWSTDLAQLDLVATTEQVAGFESPNGIAPAPPAAEAAALIATPKGRIEQPLLRATASRAALSRPQFESAPDDNNWAKIAALHGQSAKLDESSKALMRIKNPTAFDAGRRAMSKTIVEDPLLRAVRNLERSIAEDTVRNEYLLHSRIHEWFVGGQATIDVEKLNAKVYAELFLTPDSDPWLGLVPRDTYTALEADGVVQAVKR